MRPSIFPMVTFKIRLAAAQLLTAIAQLAPNWKWKIDGLATGVVLVVLILNRTAVKESSAGPWMNVVALFCLGLILRRNLRAKQKANPSPPEKPSPRQAAHRG